MMNIKKILTNPKGVDWNLRQITIVFRFAQTIVAFANDAGGDLNIGVMYDLREVVELDEDKLIVIKEKISYIETIAINM